MGYNQKEIQNLLNYDQHTVYNALNLFNVKPETRKIRSYEDSCIAVCQIDKNTNEIIRIFESIGDAERATGNGRHIASVCKGKRETANGYKWKYLNEM